MPAAEFSSLRAPFSENGVSEVAQEKFEGLERLASKLKIIENHKPFILLRNCCVFPKMQYILHTVIYGRRGEI